MKQAEAGFTLVELMLTIVVAAILVGLALPNFTDLMRRNKLLTITNQLQTDLMMARDEAIKRNQQVVVCYSSNGSSCSDSAGNWKQGWLAFADADADEILDAGEVLLKSAPAIAEGYDIFTPDTYDEYIVFRADGSVEQAGNFTLCDRDGVTADSRSIVFNQMGRPRRTQGTNPCS